MARGVFLERLYTFVFNPVGLGRAAARNAGVITLLRLPAIPVKGLTDLKLPR